MQNKLAHDDRQAICVDRIPTNVSLGEICLVPFEDQPDDDILITSYKQDGALYFSISIALTMAGTIKRAQDFARDIPGCSIRLVRFQVCLESERYDTHYRYEIYPEPLPTTEAERSFSSSYRRVTPELPQLKPSSVPFELLSTTFLAAVEQAGKTGTEGRPNAAREGTNVGLRGQNAIRMAINDADRLEREALRIIERKREADRQLRQLEQSQSFADGTELPQDDQLEQARERAASYARYAQEKILAAEEAREMVQVTREVVQFENENDHDLQPEPTVKYEIILGARRCAKLPIPPLPEDLSRVVIPERGVRQWRFPTALSAHDRYDCARYICDTIEANGIRGCDYDIRYSFGRKKFSRFLQIKFRRPEDYKLAKGIYFVWRNQPLRPFHRAKPRARRHLTLLSIDNFIFGEDPYVMVDELYMKVRRTLRLEAVWRLNQVHKLRDTLVTTEGSSMIALTSYKRAKKPFVRLYGPRDVPRRFKDYRDTLPIILSDRPHKDIQSYRDLRDLNRKKRWHRKGKLWLRPTCLNHDKIALPRRGRYV